MLSLNVAISTHRASGIERVAKMIPERHEGVSYVISWQEHCEYPVPDSLRLRDDVKVYRFEKKGLSLNRNNAIEHCEGNIVLIADDDINYTRDFYKKIGEAFEKYQEMDLALFKIAFPVEKKYPDKDIEIQLPFPKNYYVSSAEIAFRKNRIGDLRFWEGLGLGSSSMHSGEETLFLVSAIKRGLNCRFIKEFIGIHSLDSTAQKKTKEVLKGDGFIIALMYPFTSFLRIPLKACRLRKSAKVPFLFSLYHLQSGAFTCFLKHSSLPKNCR